jgi:hypothetical protein
MVEHINHEMRKTAKVVVQNVNFISFTFDEVTSMDNASWASVHSYVVQDWSRIPLLLNVQQVFSRSQANSLTLLIMNSLMTQGDLKEEELVARLVCFGVDGVDTFQGLRSRIIV